MEERIHKLQSELVKFQTLADDYKQTIKELEGIVTRHTLEVNGYKQLEKELRTALENAEI
jgi:hypothetical protein